MELRVSLLPTLEGVQDDVDVAIVIDVLRATSAITMAMASGARRVWTVPTVDQAFSLRTNLNTNLDRPPLLCGERKCQPIPGFDLGNSPAEYGPQNVRDRELIFSTTNGTKAIESAKAAIQVWLGSFLNRSAIVSMLSERTLRTDVKLDVIHLVCAGTDGDVTREDVLLAGHLAADLTQTVACTLANDQARIAMSVFDEALNRNAGGQSSIDPKSLEAEFHDCLGGRNLLANGYLDDLDFCSRIDLIDRVARRQSRSGIACFN